LHSLVNNNARIAEDLPNSPLDLFQVEDNPPSNILNSFSRQGVILVSKIESERYAWHIVVVTISSTHVKCCLRTDVFHLIPLEDCNMQLKPKIILLCPNIKATRG